MSVLLQPLKAAKGFVIVIDPKSHSMAQSEVNGYARAIEQVNKMKVYIVEDRWGIPDSIRACLQGMYSRGMIQGAVFVGDIPVPMIRDAQHLTSAFKMSQRMAIDKSSVPSDRFYDDFGLKFRYLEKDSTSTLFYYSLRADGDQRINSNLFSGRIRPTDAGGTSRKRIERGGQTKPERRTAYGICHKERARAHTAAIAQGIHNVQPR